MNMDFDYVKVNEKKFKFDEVKFDTLKKNDTISICGYDGSELLEMTLIKNGLKIYNYKKTRLRHLEKACLDNMQQKFAKKLNIKDGIVEGMKFYEFKDYEYYGLLIAQSMEDAKNGYYDNIAEKEPSEEDLNPVELTKEEAKAVFFKNYATGAKEEFKLRKFKKEIEKYNQSNSDYNILLIDNSLLS